MAMPPTIFITGIEGGATSSGSREARDPTSLIFSWMRLGTDSEGVGTAIYTKYAHTLVVVHDLLSDIVDAGDMLWVKVFFERVKQWERVPLQFL
jgi:hypothetical protein